MKTLVPGTILAATVLAAIVTSACTGTAISPSQTPPYTQADLVVGTGATVTSGATLSVNYTGWLYDPSKADFKGLMFDSTTGSDGTQTPFQFTLGAGAVIQGWEKGVPGMNVGGIRRLIIPPSLAYGDTRSGKVPPNATLVFDIQVVAIQTSSS